MEIQNLFKKEIDNISVHQAQKEALGKLRFKKDWPHFNGKNKQAYFMEREGVGFDEKSNDAFVNKVKLLLKKSPWLFSFVYNLMNPSWSGISAKKAIQGISAGNIILNLGSGVTVVRPDVINIDFYPFENVNFVADIKSLPFEDNSVDGIISECVLEHVRDPKATIEEMHRILKPGGLVYVIVPFVFSFHSSPHDFYRWSKMGLREEFRHFEETRSGIYFGPGHAVSWILSEYFGTILSFGFKKLHQILFMVFLILFTPLCYLDFILNKIKTSENIASHVYFLGHKK